MKCEENKENKTKTMKNIGAPKKTPRNAKPVGPRPMGTRLSVAPLVLLLVVKRGSPPSPPGGPDSSARGVRQPFFLRFLLVLDWKTQVFLRFFCSGLEIRAVSIKTSLCTLFTTSFHVVSSF